MLSEIDLEISNNPTSTAQLIHFKKDRKQRRKKRGKRQDQSINKQHLDIKTINPLTENQTKSFDAWEKGSNLLLHGIAGTGKSFISLYLALKELSYHNSYYKNITIIRSVVPTRDMGFLPGNVKEKSKAYELPYQTICSNLFGRGDSYDVLKNKHIIDFMTTSFIRGNTFNDSIIIVDEINNMSFHELDSIITRLGDNSRIILCGDYRQSDLKPSEKGGLHTFMKVIDHMKGFFHVEFDVEDVVRSGLVKEYIIAKETLGLT